MNNINLSVRQIFAINNLCRYLKAVFVICSLVVAFSANAIYPVIPGKGITIIVPFKEGGSTDKIARIIAKQLALELDVNVFVRNVSGLGGSIGTTEIKQENADGYTLGISTLSSLATYPALHSDVKYDPLGDFIYIVNIAQSPHILVINPKFPAKDFKTFIETIKQAKKPYTYASSGAGSMPNLLMEYMQLLTNSNLVHVPFTGASSGVKSVVAGINLIMLDQGASVMPVIKNGNLVPIAVGSAKRLDYLPNVPTFAELGYPQLNRDAFYGLVAPKGISVEALQKLNTVVNKILKKEDVISEINLLGYAVKGGTSEQFEQDIKAEIKAYKEIVNSERIFLDKETN